MPNALQILAKGENGLAFVRRQGTGPMLLAAVELALCVLEFAQRAFPLDFKAACDEPIFGFNGPITPLGAVGRIARTFDAQAPLLQCIALIGLELLRRT